MWLLLAIAMLLPTGPLQAQRGAAGGGDASRSAVVDRLEQRTGGRVLSLDPERRDGREVYRARVLTDQGRVRHFDVDPRDGQPIRP